MTASTTRSDHLDTDAEELHGLKRDLLKAEVALAKARATAVAAEIDIRVLTAKLKAFAK